VTERTKEIGIRMAVGARRRDILFQFLIESSFMAFWGGVIGIALGVLIARIVTAATSMPSRVEPVSVALAVIMSTSIGLFFGLYPANGLVDPVDALRTAMIRQHIPRGLPMALDSIRSLAGPS
jgi:putative ABC transport system permease protein